jgi:hypothetical protein
MNILKLIHEGEIDIITDYCDGHDILLEYINPMYLSLTRSDWSGSGDKTIPRTGIGVLNDIFYSRGGDNYQARSRSGYTACLWSSRR